MNRHDLLFLRSQQKYPSISIFVRTHRAMPQRERDEIAINNAIAEAKELLLKEFTERDVQDILDNLDYVVRSIDHVRLLDGLAIYVNAYVKQIFYLPFAVENRVVINHSFWIKDILRILAKMPRYWVLSLSENATRLFQGVGDTITEIVEPETDEMGISRDGFPLNYVRPEMESDVVRSGGSMAWTTTKENNYFDAHKRVFFEKVDRLLGRFTVVEPLPLIIVGTEHNCHLFKDGVRHGRVVAEVHGDYTHRSYGDIAVAVSAAMQKYLAAEMDKKVLMLQEAQGRLQCASGVKAVWRMAKEGRVHELLVEEDYTVSGRVDAENPLDVLLEVQGSTDVYDDLINQLIEEVLDKRGNVLFCKPGSLKDHQHVAAILRY